MATMLTICTWLWGDKYGLNDVERLAAGLARNLSIPYRFRCITNEPKRFDGRDILAWPIDDKRVNDLLLVKGCFARLKMFDQAWQKAHQIGYSSDDRLACIDLDVVITGQLDTIFNHLELSFAIVQGANSSNPCPYNGSLFMLQPGVHQDVWLDFSLEAAKKIPFYEFPDDQGWLAHKIPGAPMWQVGPGSGIYAFQKPGWPKGDALPADAKLVVFPGWRSPNKFKHLPWIKKHWTK